jgi:glycosyltransferase involved in cell wall biosynthesis
MRQDELRAIADAAQGLRVTLYNRYLARPHLLRLLRECDGYVSLHRAEGFGFTLVEAMALGKPVVATYYSANTEYMTPWNSFPVPYRMGEVRVRRGAYAPGRAWAEADVPAAAEILRVLYGDRDLGRRIGRQAQADVRAQLASEVCGGRMVRRLRAIGSGDTTETDGATLASTP